MLQITDLSFRYNDDGPIINFPDVNLNRNEHLLILGNSGVGKTTLLHLMAGLLKPASGAVAVDGKKIDSLSHAALDRFRGEKIGLVFQNNHAINSLTVHENLQTRLWLSKSKENSLQIDKVLEALQLQGVKNNRANHISQGQLQRLAIAMAVIHKPSLILADEPTSSLDDDNCHAVMRLLISQANQHNANLVVVTHDHRVKSMFEKSITL